MEALLYKLTYIQRRLDWRVEKWGVLTIYEGKVDWRTVMSLPHTYSLTQNINYYSVLPLDTQGHQVNKKVRSYHPPNARKYKETKHTKGQFLFPCQCSSWKPAISVVSADKLLFIFPRLQGSKHSKMRNTTFFFPWYLAAGFKERKIDVQLLPGKWHQTHIYR